MRVTAATRLATRQRILEAAKKLFAEEGFDTATTRDVARRAGIATGTLFNYFPTKESIVLSLVGEWHTRATEVFWQEKAPDKPALTLEEELFAHVAEGLRKLRPFRKYLPVALEPTLSPLVAEEDRDEPSLRAAHLESVGRILAQHGYHDASPLALQLYWTLYTGVLTFWAKDASPRQESTYALLDESLAMFAGWLSSRADSNPSSATGE